MFKPLEQEINQVPLSTAPGLHIIADFTSEETLLLSNFRQFKSLTEKLIAKYSLQKLGEVYHNFPGGGFTGIICLSESHLSIHTWPERNYITFDIFLSNFLNNNRETTKNIYKDVKAFFNATVINENFINR